MASTPDPDAPSKSRGEEWGELPPLLVAIEEFVEDDVAVQRRAMMRLVALLEAPITVHGRRGLEISPGLARLRADIAMHLTGLVPAPKLEEAAGRAPDPKAGEGARGAASSNGNGLQRRTG